MFVPKRLLENKSSAKDDEPPTKKVKSVCRLCLSPEIIKFKRPTHKNKNKSPKNKNKNKNRRFNVCMECLLTYYKMNPDEIHRPVNVPNIRPEDLEFGDTVPCESQNCWYESNPRRHREFEQSTGLLYYKTPVNVCDVCYEYETDINYCKVCVIPLFGFDIQGLCYYCPKNFNEVSKDINDE